ncbi:hypothetical protein FA10DRAFT_76743 [Acaromyces ingoldii]|uniref:Zn(2)-C6 fungal-type domain-containing protein n=1 Tax=Acaromyces ingoldii TaxID=215250 RepID=A0A316YRD5_9BASI|nr:hypothetical protein FA10DRAFT_76743 [Acaromyces ingoldii]PWN91859.1 hypothetical protein FA10DRAFT_76743 [Acaromyces ingoldii]
MLRVVPSLFSSSFSPPRTPLPVNMSAITQVPPAPTPAAGASNRKRSATVATSSSTETEAAIRTGDEEAKVKRRRRRVAKSCFNCRQRKVKCDRVIPCLQCCLRGEQGSCTVSTSFPTSSSISTSSQSAAATLSRSSYNNLSLKSSTQRLENAALSDGDLSIPLERSDNDVSDAFWTRRQDGVDEAKDEARSLSYAAVDRASASSSSMPPPPRPPPQSVQTTLPSGEQAWAVNIEAKLDRLEARLDRLLDSVESLEQYLVKPRTQWPPPSSMQYPFAAAVDTAFDSSLKPSQSIASNQTSTESPGDTAPLRRSSSSTSPPTVPSVSGSSTLAVSAPLKVNMQNYTASNHTSLLLASAGLLIDTSVSPTVPHLPVSSTLTTGMENWTDLLGSSMAPGIHPWTSVTTR